MQKLKKILKAEYPEIDFIFSKDPILNIIEVSYINSNDFSPNEIITTLKKANLCDNVIISKKYNNKRSF